MTEKAHDVLERARSRNKQLQDYLRPAADFFHRNEGTMFGRKEAREEIGKELDVDENTAGAVIAQLVSDKVDPIVQVAADDEKFVGVAEFHEFDGAYGYLEYDDAIGARRRVVCQQCVNNSDFDKEVTHATEQSPDPESSTFKQDVEYTDLVNKVHQHYQSSHESTPTEIATGATLASGTTIGGNTSFHAGNDGPGSGLDADTIDGQNRYQDSEARTAVSGSSIDGSNFTGISDGPGVSDNGSLVVSETKDINFGAALDVIDDGDGTATVDAASPFFKVESGTFSIGGNATTRTTINLSQSYDHIIATAGPVSDPPGASLIQVALDSTTSNSVTFFSQNKNTSTFSVDFFVLGIAE